MRYAARLLRVPEQRPVVLDLQAPDAPVVALYDTLPNRARKRAMNGAAEPLGRVGYGNHCAFRLTRIIDPLHKYAFPVAS